MKNSSTENQLFTCTLKLQFRGGSVVSVPTVAFSDKADAEAYNRERSGFLQAISKGLAVLPAPGRDVELPVSALLSELGVMQIGLGIEPVEARSSSLVVAKPNIIMAR